MKLKNMLIVGVPPVAVVGSIAIFNPSALTWPMLIETLNVSQPDFLPVMAS